MLELQIERTTGDQFQAWLDELGKYAVYGLGKTEDEAIEDFKNNVHDFLGQLPSKSAVDAPCYASPVSQGVQPCGEWISVKERLPNNKETVLIKTNKTNVFGYNNELKQYHVATFVRGKTKDEVEKTKCFCAHDEEGNNLRPYNWEGDGPCNWFGQEITHWKYISKVGV